MAEAFGDEIENLPQVIGAPLLYAIPLAGLSLAIAAYTPRRAYATGAIIAVFIVTAAVSAILGEAVTNGPIGDLAPADQPVRADRRHPRTAARRRRRRTRRSPAPASRCTGSPSSGWLLSLVSAGVVLWRYRRLAA